MKVLDKKFETDRATRGKFKQYGSHTYQSAYNRPMVSRLRLYERIALLDNFVEACFDAVCNEVISTIGMPEHPDPEITNFLYEMLSQMQEDLGYSYHSCLYHMLKTELWGGFQVTEPLFEVRNGKLVLEDLVTYHPSTISIVPDNNGRLREGKKTLNDTRLSGIYQQPTNTSVEVRLPLWKTLYTANHARFGNYYGRSMVSSIYKWHRLKETLIDMMVTSLDRFGNPLLWVRTSNRATGRMETNPSTGEEYSVSAQQEIQEQIEDLDGNGNVIVLTQTDAEMKPEVGALTTGNDVGTTFLEAIDYASEQIAIGLYPPFFLISDRTKIGSSSDTLIERRMDQFKNLVNVKRNQITKVFCKKVLGQIVQWNFSKEAAKITPSLSYVHSSRQEKLVDKMQSIKGLTEDGYLNPMDEVDWRMVRQMVHATPREMEDKDKQFIKKMILDPKEKTTGSSKRESTTNSQTKKTNPDRGRQGQGVKGRPTGSSTKQNNPRSSQK